jgi:hypothetical protein
MLDIKFERALTSDKQSESWTKHKRYYKIYSVRGLELLFLRVYHDKSCILSITSYGGMNGTEFYEGDDLEEVTHNGLIADGYTEISEEEFMEIAERMRNDPTPVVYPAGPPIYEFLPETGEYVVFRYSNETGKEEVIYRGQKDRMYEYLPKTDELVLLDEC